MDCEVTGLYFSFFFFSAFYRFCLDGYWSASRHVTVRGASLLKPALPEDARCLIRNKCSQTETQTHQRDLMCADVCVCRHRCVLSLFFLSFFLLHSRWVKTAGAELRRSRTSSHGHLPVHDASQKSDKPKLLFIPRLPPVPHAIAPQTTNCTDGVLDFSFSFTFSPAVRLLQSVYL